MLPISRLSTDAIALFDQHFARHRAESGRDGFHFMPFAPDDDEGPGGLDAKLFELTLDTPGWAKVVGRPYQSQWRHRRSC